MRLKRGSGTWPLSREDQPEGRRIAATMQVRGGHRGTDSGRGRCQSGRGTVNSWLGSRRSPPSASRSGCTGATGPRPNTIASARRWSRAGPWSVSIRKSARIPSSAAPIPATSPASRTAPTSVPPVRKAPVPPTTGSPRRKSAPNSTASSTAACAVAPCTWFPSAWGRWARRFPTSACRSAIRPMWR